MRYSINIPNFGDFADARTVARVATAAEEAGWTVTYWAVPGQGHSGPTLTKGLTTAYNQLIPLWTRSGATSAGDRALCSPDQPARACGLGIASAVAGATAMVDLSLLAVFLSAHLLLFFTRRGRAPVAAAAPVTDASAP